MRELAVGLPFAGALDPDQAAIRLLACLVESELMESLRYRLGLIYVVRLLVDLFTDCGQVCLAVEAPRRQARQLEREMNAVLDRLCAGEFSADQVERVRSAALGRCTVETQSNEQQMTELAQDAGLLLGRPPANLAGHIAEVTLDDLRRTAARLLRGDNRQWVVQQPNLPLFLVGTAAFTVLAVFTIVGSFQIISDALTQLVNSLPH